MTFRDLLLEKQDIHDDVYWEEDENKIYVYYIKTGEQDTYSKSKYYVYGGASKTLQIYAKGNKLVAEYWNAGWNGKGSKLSQDIKKSKSMQKARNFLKGN